MTALAANLASRTAPSAILATVTALAANLASRTEPSPNLDTVTAAAAKLASRTDKGPRLGAFTAPIAISICVIAFVLVATTAVPEVALNGPSTLSVDIYRTQ